MHGLLKRGKARLLIAWLAVPTLEEGDQGSEVRIFQTLLNDVLVSAITRRPCYILSTATMEARAGGARKGVRWSDTPEAKQRPVLMEAVR